MGVLFTGEYYALGHAPSGFQFEMWLLPLQLGGLFYMAQFLHSMDLRTFRKFRIFFLALSWVLGLGFGDYVFRVSGSNFVSQMPLAVMCQPSLFGLLTTALLPFLFSAFAVYISAPKLLFLIAFTKAVLFGFASCAVCTAFGNSGWLVRLLLLFTDICSVVFLYHFWLRHLSGLRVFSSAGFFGYLFPVFCIVLADYYYISPLLQRCILL